MGGVGEAAKRRARGDCPGIYILLGPSDVSPSGLAVYAGEGDDVWTRIRSHDDAKDFWEWVVIFVSKDAACASRR
jgi:hypothetical protein